jgi:CheY-like chemotaxis protein
MAKLGMDRTPQSFRVLIIEDDCDGAVSLAKLLRSLSNFDISFTTSPVQAIADALQHTPDAVISDIGLPQMDGCELAVELQVIIRELTGSRPLLIAVTGDGEAQERCRAAGFDHFFRKPASAGVLLGLLHNHANRLKSVETWGSEASTPL